MSSQVQFSNQAVVVKTNIITGKNFGFFESLEHGDIFVHQNTLEKFGFKPTALVPGFSALVDAVEVKGKLRVAAIHELNAVEGKLVTPPRSRRPARKEPNKLYPGITTVARVKSVHDGYVFAGVQDSEDAFIPKSKVARGLVDYLEKGVDVKITTFDGERGVIARVDEIIWSKDQLALQQLDREGDQFIVRLTDPTGKSRIEIRLGSRDGEMVATSATVKEARELIGRQLPNRETVGQKTNVPTLSQAMKGQGSSGKKKAA